MRLALSGARSISTQVLLEQDALRVRQVREIRHQAALLAGGRAAPRSKTAIVRLIIRLTLLGSLLGLTY